MSAWVYAYILQLLLISTALGLLGVYSPKVLILPRTVRFLTGFCLAPFFVGAWMIGFAALAPGASRWLFVAGPVVASLITIAKLGPRYFRSPARGCVRVFKRLTWVNYCVYGLGIVLFGAVIAKLLHNGQFPVTAHDAVFYLREALPFATARDLAAINGFRGAADGSLNGDIHGFLFPAFLSHALLQTGQQVPGFPSDLPMRFAFQSTVVYMLLAVLAFAKTTRVRMTATIAVIFVLLAPQLYYISYASSRDGFRIVPLLLLATVLAGLKPCRFKNRIKILPLIPVAVISAFCLYGHTIGGFVVLTLGAAWAVWAYGNNMRAKYLLAVLGAIAVGLAVASGHYVAAFVETGSIAGTNVFSGDTIAGTPLWTETVRRYADRLSGATVFGRVNAIFGQESQTISTVGLLGSVLLAASFGAGRSGRRDVRLFIGLVVLMGLLPFSGLFDLGKYRISEWFAVNYRYKLHWFVFGAVAGAAAVSYIYQRLTDNRYLRAGSKSGIKLLINLLFILFLISQYSTARHTVHDWQTQNADIFDFVRQQYLSLPQAAMEKLPPGKRLLTDYGELNYYVHPPAMILTTQPTKKIIQAKSEAEALAVLQQMNIGAVALTEPNIKNFYDKIPLYQVLENSQHAVLLGKTYYIRVYMLKQ